MRDDTLKPVGNNSLGEFCHWIVSHEDSFVNSSEMIRVV